MNPKPQIGDIWCCYASDKEEYHLVTNYKFADPTWYMSDTVEFLSLVDGNHPYSKHLATRIINNTNHWRKIS